jgi:hypothetical protein
LLHLCMCVAQNTYVRVSMVSTELCWRHHRSCFESRCFNDTLSEVWGNITVQCSSCYVVQIQIFPSDNMCSCYPVSDAVNGIYIVWLKKNNISSEFLATDPEVLGSIPGASRFSERQWVWNGVHSASWV